jgi:hypothetical protein
MAVRLSALSAGRPLSPGRFLVLISVRGSVDPRAIVRLEGKFKKSNSLIGNRIRQFRTCILVPVPTTLQRAPNNISSNNNHSIPLFDYWVKVDK